MVWGKVEDPDSSEAYSEDDGLFDKGERAQKHYDEMFSPKEAAQKKAADTLRNADNEAASSTDRQAGGRTDTISSQKNREETSSQSTFKNNVSGRDAKTKTKTKNAKGGLLKKAGQLSQYLASYVVWVAACLVLKA